MLSRLLTSAPIALRLVLGAAGGVGVSAAAAIAQVEAVAPYAVVTTANDASLRCGDSSTYYVVGTLKAGTVLRVDGQSSGFLRVVYPAGSRALVPADEGALDPTGKMVRLSKPSRLKASNAMIARNSWNQLLDRELTPGTELQLIDSVKNDDGKVTYYAVTPPADARAFISASLVRKATAEENAAAFNTPATPMPAAPAPAIPSARPTTPVESKPAEATATPPANAVKPVETKPIESKPALPEVGGKMGEPPVPPSPVEPSTVITPGKPPAPAATEPAATPAAAEPAKIEPPKVSPTEHLLKLFERVQKQPLMEAELEGALNEFQQYIATLTTSAADQRVARGLTVYTDALRLRMDIREAKRRNEAGDKELAATRASMTAKLADLQKQRYYAVIGRLVSSTIYDGGRQPLMFRVVSPEPGFMRTLGYIVPDKEFDLAPKLGLVVGIEGDVRRDEALKANVISPRRIDIVSLSPVGEVLGTEPVPSGATAIPAPAEKPAPGSGTGQMRPAIDLDGTGWRPSVPPVKPQETPEPQKP